MTYNPTEVLGEILGRPAVKGFDPKAHKYECPFLGAKCTKRSTGERVSFAASDLAGFMDGIRRGGRSAERRARRSVWQRTHSLKGPATVDAAGKPPGVLTASATAPMIDYVVGRTNDAAVCDPRIEPMHSITYGRARRQLGARNADRLWRCFVGAGARARLTDHEHATLRAHWDNPDTAIARFNRHCIVRRAHGLGPDYGELIRPTTP